MSGRLVPDDAIATSAWRQSGAHSNPSSRNRRLRMVLDGRRRLKCPGFLDQSELEILGHLVTDATLARFLPRFASVRESGVVITDGGLVVSHDGHVLIIHDLLELASDDRQVGRRGLRSQPKAA